MGIPHGREKKMTKKILVVDDEPHIVTMLEARLKKSGYEVITAHDGIEGLKKAQIYKPDIIIADILMPHMDGSSMAQELKINPYTRNIPIIFLTCLIKAERDKHTQQIIGNNLFIAKPFDVLELLAMVDKMVKK